MTKTRATDEKVLRISESRLAELAYWVLGIFLGMLLVIIVLVACNRSLTTTCRNYAALCEELSTKEDGLHQKLAKTQEDRDFWQLHYKFSTTNNPEPTTDGPPPISLPPGCPEEEDSSVTDEEILDYVTEQFGSMETSGPGR